MEEPKFKSYAQIQFDLGILLAYAKQEAASYTHHYLAHDNIIDALELTINLIQDMLDQ